MLRALSGQQREEGGLVPQSSQLELAGASRARAELEGP